MPEYGRTIMPEYGRTIMPEYGRTIMPEYGCSIMLIYEDTAPGFGHDIRIIIIMMIIIRMGRSSIYSYGAKHSLFVWGSLHRAPSMAVPFH